MSMYLSVVIYVLKCRTKREEILCIFFSFLLDSQVASTNQYSIQGIKDILLGILLDLVYLVASAILRK